MQDFYTEMFIQASPDQVWKAFVEPKQFFWAFYQADIRSSFNLGDRLEYAGPYEGQEVVHIYGEVLAYEEGKLLSYTDHPGPLFNENHAAVSSRVTVRFEPMGPSTKLSLTNDQFSENNPMRDKVDQWYLILSNLKSWIETGELMKLSPQ